MGTLYQELRIETMECSRSTPRSALRFAADFTDITKCADSRGRLADRIWKPASTIGR
jgi:hypothetical protein